MSSNAQTLFEFLADSSLMLELEQYGYRTNNLTEGDIRTIVHDLCESTWADHWAHFKPDIELAGLTYYSLPELAMQ